ncbi:hypothetical protein [Mucilaginibacter sp.]|uniref:hypothetical protein n=1 Tax=Mucilaginibacter sp. TaxID=1882438 RepID=UPI003D0ED836
MDTNYPFNTAGLCTEEIDRFHDTYNVLKTKFDIALTGHIDFQLENFEVFKHYQGINIRDSYVIKHENNNSYILFIESQLKHHAHGHNGPGYECQTWALAYLKHNFGRVLIRPETLADKIIELIHPVELDFEEDKAFSDTFYVLVNDHYKAVSGIDRNFRNAVMDVREDDFVIEIVEHTLIIGNSKPISPEKAIYLAEFVSRLCTACD